MHNAFLLVRAPALPTCVSVPCWCVYRLLRAQHQVHFYLSVSCILCPIADWRINAFPFWYCLPCIGQALFIVWLMCGQRRQYYASECHYLTQHCPGYMCLVGVQDMCNAVFRTCRRKERNWLCRTTVSAHRRSAFAILHIQRTIAMLCIQTPG